MASGQALTTVPNPLRVTNLAFWSESEVRGALIVPIKRSTRGVCVLNCRQTFAESACKSAVSASHQVQVVQHLSGGRRIIRWLRHRSYLRGQISYAACNKFEPSRSLTSTSGVRAEASRFPASFKVTLPALANRRYGLNVINSTSRRIRAR